MNASVEWSREHNNAAFRQLPKRRIWCGYQTMLPMPHVTLSAAKGQGLGVVGI